jgi:hypothetical protein
VSRKSNYVTYDLYEQKRETFLQEAEGNHILRRAGLIQPNILAGFGHRAAGWFGRTFVSLGRRFEQMECAGQSPC